MTRSRTCLLSFVALLLLLARPAHAYIDPTAGSLMLQLVLGGLAGLGIAVRLMWRRIGSVLRRHPGTAEKSADETTR
jgi:hypothetical protein